MAIQFLNDELVGLMSASFLRRENWRTWTPTVTQGVGITLSGTVGKYLPLGPLCVINGGANFTSAGTAGSIIRMAGLPTAITPLNFLVGGARFFDSGTTVYAPLIYWNGAVSAFEFQCDQSASSLGAGPAYTIANSDSFNFFALMEIAV